MAFSEDQLERYSRHFVLPGVGVSGQKKLLQSRVLVVGAGALGSPVLLYLAAAGVGTLGIADDDRVDLSNLQRQIIHRTTFVGAEKLTSAKHAIEELNPDVRVVLHRSRVTPDNIRTILEGYDLVVDCTDRFASKFLINDACVLARKPYIHAGIVRFAGQIMTYVPGKGPCLRCLMRKIPTGEQLTCSQAGVLGAATGVLGSLQAVEAVKCLLGIGEPLVGRMLYFDGMSMEFQPIQCGDPSPDCPVCGTHPTILSVSDHREEYEDRQSCGIGGAGGHND